MKCDHCGATGADFGYNGSTLCCECMSELCSWFLDGGWRENPDQFAYLISDEDRERFLMGVGREMTTEKGTE